jgi:hypothetical protein
MTGAQLARKLLREAAVECIIEVGRVDQYDSERRTIRLTRGVFYGTNTYAAAIAAHEVGHALQEQFWAMRVRRFIVWIAPWFFIGTGGVIVFAPPAGQVVGLVGLLSAWCFFRTISVILERDATKRALDLLERQLDEASMIEARYVLRQALRTYL